MIFADPTRQLYHALGMNIETLGTTPAEQQKRSYLTMGRFANAMHSIWVRLSREPHADRELTLDSREAL